MTTLTAKQQEQQNEYALRSQAIEQKLAQLTALRRTHAKKSAAKPGHWGYNGDLHAVIEQLDEAICMLGGAS